MTYTCTVAWCAYDGRNLPALRKHVRIVHPWLAAREQQDRIRAEIETAHNLGRSHRSMYR